jgi:hypothetical protein
MFKTKSKLESRTYKNEDTGSQRHITNVYAGFQTREGYEETGHFYNLRRKHSKLRPA